MVLRLAAAAAATSVVVVSAGEGSSSSGLLSNLFISEGHLEPPFNPATFQYEVTLTHGSDSNLQLAVIPEAETPVVVDWPGKAADGGAVSPSPSTSPTAFGVNVELPEDGGSLPLTIRVADGGGRVANEYSLLVVQRQTEPSVFLRTLTAAGGGAGGAVLVLPAVSSDAAVYTVHCPPASDSVTVSAACARGNELLLDGSKAGGFGHPHEASFTLPREKQHWRQTATVSCRASGVTRNYVLALMSDWSSAAIEVPRLVVESRGQQCSFDGAAFTCPAPHSDDGRTRLVAAGEPTVRYTVETPAGDTQVRLLPGVPSLPFAYDSRSLRVIGLASRERAVWPVAFSGAAQPGVFAFLGWLLGLKLLVLLLTLLLLLGAFSSSGIGAPIGLSEITSAMTFLLQFFSFSSSLRGGDSPLVSLCGSFHWITFFWPLPGQPGTIGDAGNLNNAKGCLVWTLTAFLLSVAFHGVVALAVSLRCGGRAAFPHRLRFGNWESRVLHWLTFPLAAAAGAVWGANSDRANFLWKLLAAFEILGVGGWIGWNFLNVQKAVRNGDVLWMWHSSLREDGELAAENGFWADALADQLNTHAVNRSVVSWYFPWRWTTVVGDIEPQRVAAANGTGATVFPPNVFAQRPHRDGGYPLAKAPRSVTLVRAAAPSGIYRGARVIAGLLRTRWLDVLMTQEAVTMLQHDAEAAAAAATAATHLKLTVKTEQLVGRLTGGTYHFYYDGVRLPFVRIGSFLLRLAVGTCLGLAFASESLRQDTLTFALIAFFSLLMLLYVICARPFSRHVENGVVVALQSVIFLTSAAFCGYAAANDKPQRFADAALWLTALAAGAMSLYACLVLVSLYSAVCCPPLDETRFLEGLANCAVVVADHSRKLRVEMPGYSKKGCRDLRAHCDGKTVTVYPSGDVGRLEFTLDEFTEGMQSRQLSPPVLAVYMETAEDSLGYRTLRIYNAADIYADLVVFLTGDPQTKGNADIIARRVAQHYAATGRNQILSLTLLSRKATHLSSSMLPRSKSAGPRQRKVSSIEMM